MPNSLSYELHNECYKLVSRKSNINLVNEVMNRLNINKKNINKKNIIENNIHNNNIYDNRYKDKKYFDYNNQTFIETIMIKIIKLIMCIR